MPRGRKIQSESEPSIHQVHLTEEQVERFETNRINGIMLLAVIEDGDYAPEEALGCPFHYIVDSAQRDNVIISEVAVAQHLRYMVGASEDINRKERLESLAKDHDLRDFGISIPRSKIVDVDAPTGDR